MKIKNLDHFVLTVKNIEKSVEFYTKVLGMKKEIFKQNRVALKFGNSKINLHELGKEFEPKAKNVKNGSADLCFIVEDKISDIIAHLKKQKIEIIEGPVQRTGSNGAIVSVYIRDLDGNLIELSNY